MNSPIGSTVVEVGRQDASRSPAYRAEQQRLEPYEQQLARIVIRRRIEFDLTQEELAGQIGTSRAPVSRIERGQHPSSLRMLLRLATALGIDVEHGSAL